MTRDDRKELAELAAEFARREILPHVDAWEKAGELPRELSAKSLAGRACLGLGYPEELGGAGSHADLMTVQEELILNGVPTGVIASLFTHGIAIPSIIVRHGTPEQKERFAVPAIKGEKIGALAVTEPGGGSDVAHLTTRARPTSDRPTSDRATSDRPTAVSAKDHYVVNGTKTFITSGTRADFVTTAVRTGDPSDPARAGHKGISLLVIERGTPGFTVSRKLDKMGWLSSDTAELSFADVRVPAANLIGPEHQGFWLIMEQFMSERLSIALQCAAVARRCVDLTIEWAKNRTTFGDPLSSRQVIRHKIAEMARQADVARTYVWAVARKWEKGEDVITEVSMAKNTAVYAAEHVVHEAVQIHGGLGYMRESEVERHYRDIRIMGIGGGTSEIMNEVIARRVVGPVSVIKSALDASSPEYETDKAAMTRSLAELEELARTVLAAGGEKKHDRHRERGKLLARERVDLLLDEDTPFLELSMYAGAHEPGEQPGARVITGVGQVSGVQCMIIANEATVKGGSVSPSAGAKQSRALEIAERNRLPLISLTESGGADLPRQADIFVPGGRTFRTISRLSAQGIPTISIVFGSSTAGGAYVPGMSEYTVLVDKHAAVYLGGPPLTKMATGEDTDDETLGGAEMHARVSGLADYLAADEPAAIRIGRQIVKDLGWKRAGPPPAVTAPEPPRYDARELLGVAPAESKRPMEVREVLARILDGSDFDEFKPLYGPQLVCGWGSINGYQVGILANNGILFSPESNKGAHFIQLANARDIPLLFVQNITGFMVGTAAEHGGIIKDGAKMINAVSNSAVPHLTLMVGASYGAGNYAMSGRAYDPRFIFTWPNHRIAVMGGTQLAGVMSIVMRKSAERKGQPYDDAADKMVREQTEQLIEEQSRALYATGRVWDDGIIDPRHTRTVLSLALAAVHSAPIAGAARYAPFRM